MRRAILLMVVALIAAVLVLGPPLVTARKLRSAIVQRDQAALPQLVDFDQLHSNVMARVNQRIADENRGRLLGGIREAFGQQLADRLVDRMATPAGFIGVICDHALEPKPAPAACVLDGSVRTVHFESLSRLTVRISRADGEQLSLRLQREGWHWKLVDLVMPTAVFDQIREQALQ